MIRANAPAPSAVVCIILQVKASFTALSISRVALEVAPSFLTSGGGVRNQWAHIRAFSTMIWTAEVRLAAVAYVFITVGPPSLAVDVALALLALEGCMSWDGAVVALHSAIAAVVDISPHVCLALAVTPACLEPTGTGIPCICKITSQKTTEFNFDHQLDNEGK